MHHDAPPSRRRYGDCVRSRPKDVPQKPRATGQERNDETRARLETHLLEKIASVTERPSIRIRSPRPTSPDAGHGDVDVER